MSCLIALAAFGKLLKLRRINQLKTSGEKQLLLILLKVFLLEKKPAVVADSWFVYGQLRTPSAQRQPPQAGWVFPMQSS